MKPDVTQVTLFRHGVAAYVHHAEVNGDDVVAIDVRDTAMNDVLKSITVHDAAGALASIDYEPHPALGDRLEDIRVDLPRGGGLVDLLRNLTGASLSVSVGDASVTGRLVGVENIDRSTTTGVVHRAHIALVSDGAVRSVALDEVRELRLLDEDLQGDIERLLARHDRTRRASTREIRLRLKGSGARVMAVRYMTPATVWKTSYRIAVVGDGAPTLIAFALVDNDSEHNWRDVRLSLVSGLPISFTHDIYAPTIRERPHIRVETESAVAPPLMDSAAWSYDESAVSGKVTPHGSPVAQPAAAPAPAQMMRGRAAVRKGAVAESSMMAAGVVQLQDSVETNTATVRSGDQFRYDIQTPVTIDRGRSASVPIAAVELRGEVVAVYNESIRRLNPLTAIRLNNNSPLTLEAGPATVFREHEYAGEAMLDTLRPGEDRIVPFSVELSCEITTRLNSHIAAAREVQLADGHLTIVDQVTHTCVYTIANRRDRAIRLWIEHPHRDGATFWENKPKEVTESHARFVTEVKANSQVDFSVIEVERRSRTTVVQISSVDRFATILKDNGHGPHAKRLAPLVALARRDSELGRRQRDIEARLKDITADHQRLRANMKSLDPKTVNEKTLRDRYVDQLARDEETLTGLNREQRTIADQRALIAKQFAESLEML